VEVTASDGLQIAAGTSNVFVYNFLPQQKAPFYVDFGKIDFNIVSKTNAFNISLANAPPTNYIQYPDLYLNVDSEGIADNAYTVSGSITNIGNQTASNVKIYGTYYNSAGVVVAVGFVSLKDPLTPNTSANFTISEIDESIKLATKISSYVLLVQTSTKFWKESQIRTIFRFPRLLELSVSLQCYYCCASFSLQKTDTSPIVSNPASFNLIYRKSMTMMD
jgi:hypothetical protein